MTMHFFGWRIEISRQMCTVARDSPLDRLLSGQPLADCGFGYRCPFCRVRQDEGKQTGVYWNGEAVCGACAPLVSEMRAHRHDEAPMSP